MSFGAFFKKLIKPAVKGISRNIPKVVKGLKRGVPQVIRGIKGGVRGAASGLQSTYTAVKSGATQAFKRGKALFGFKPKPQGVVKEQVIQRGGGGARVIRPQTSQVKIAGKFDETLPTGLKPIQEIPRVGIPKRTLTKAQRLKQAKAGIKRTGMKF